MKELLTAKQVNKALEKLEAAVLKEIPADVDIAVVGIRTRGETLARRIAEAFRTEKPNRHVDFGVLDITFYRDDLSQQRGMPLVRATEIDFDLDGKWVLLVDDVLQTGRSIRAALDALHDFGRPTVIRLAVLVDRGGRELPISADFIGEKVTVEPGQRVQVKLEENDGEDGVYIQKKKA